MTILECDPAVRATRYRKLIRPNRSLSRRGLWLLIAIYALLSVSVGIGFGLALGAWLILPFFGLEVAVIAVVAVIVTRRAGDYELVMLDPERLRLVRRTAGRRSCIEFQRYWARIALASGECGWYPSRLFITSHGRSVEFGAAMAEHDRRALAQELKGLLRR